MSRAAPREMYMPGSVVGYAHCMAVLLIIGLWILLSAGVVRWALRERRIRRLTKRLEPYDFTVKR